MSNNDSRVRGHVTQSCVRAASAGCTLSLHLSVKLLNDSESLILKDSDPNLTSLGLRWMQNGKISQEKEKCMCGAALVKSKALYEQQGWEGSHYLVKRYSNFITFYSN